MAVTAFNFGGVKRKLKRRRYQVLPFTIMAQCPHTPSKTMEFVYFLQENRQVVISGAPCANIVRPLAMIFTDTTNMAQDM